jgi:hypothetical protein
MLAVVLASMSDVHRMSRIENFACDPLVQHLLGLKEDIDQDTLTGRLKALGQRGAFSLQEDLFRFTGKMMKKSNLSHITIDCDSTVATAYGNKEGAAKGYNPHKLGADSYHSQLCFCTEIKLIPGSVQIASTLNIKAIVCAFATNNRQSAYLQTGPANIKQKFIKWAFLLPAYPLKKLYLR